MAKQGIRKRVTRSRTAANAALLKPSAPVRSKLKLDQKKLGAIHVAVIARSPRMGDYTYSQLLSSNRHDDGWFALMNTDRNALIAEALQKRTEFGAERYEVWIGTLNEKVLIPTNFKVVKL